MKDMFLVAFGGAAGSVLRWSIGFLPFFNLKFPIRTFIANVLATSVLGILFFILAKNSTISKELRLLIAVGFCGGLSTFSTFSMETFELMRTGNWFQAMFYPVLSLGVCLGILGVMARLGGVFAE